MTLDFVLNLVPWIAYECDLDYENGINWDNLIYLVHITFQRKPKIIRTAMRCIESHIMPVWAER